MNIREARILLNRYSNRNPDVPAEIRDAIQCVSNYIKQVLNTEYGKAIAELQKEGLKK